MWISGGLGCHWRACVYLRLILPPEAMFLPVICATTGSHNIVHGLLLHLKAMLMWVAYTSVWHHVDNHNHCWCCGPYWVLCSCCNLRSRWCSLPMLPPKAKICAATWNHIDTYSTFSLKPMLMALACAITECYDSVCGPILWQRVMWIAMKSLVRAAARDYMDIYGLCCFQMFLWKSKIHTLADCKWKESYVWCGFDDCRLTVTKEGHVRLLRQPVPSLPHSKRISLDRKLWKRTAKSCDKDSEI